MTLQDYLNQETPVKMPFVLLQEQDFEIFDLCYASDKMIRINGLPDFDYMIKKDECAVYVMDEDGNGRRRSCFHLTKPFNKMEEYQFAQFL